MSVQSILAPAFVQVLISLLLLAGLLVARVGLMRNGGPGVATGFWPEWEARVARAYANQFEMPVLFFAAVILALITRQADALFVLLAWIFVVARIAQACVHITINVLPFRSACFAVGVVALAIAWVRLFAGVMAAMPA